MLLNYVKEEDLAGCSTACASLLTAISRQLQDRLTPLEALLQTRYFTFTVAIQMKIQPLWSSDAHVSSLPVLNTSLSCPLPSRYGLYSSPFDPVLFDLEVSGSSCKNAFNSSIGVQSDEIDLSDILSGISYTLIH